MKSIDKILFNDLSFYNLLFNNFMHSLTSTQVHKAILRVVNARTFFFFYDPCKGNWIQACSLDHQTPCYMKVAVNLCLCHCWLLTPENKSYIICPFCLRPLSYNVWLNFILSGFQLVPLSFVLSYFLIFQCARPSTFTWGVADSGTSSDKKERKVCP